jgi:elongation factor G
MSAAVPTARRNLGIIAHIDAGKTTLTEQLLCLGGVIRRPGSVEDGSTVSDWMAAEQRRGITIGSAAVTCAWGETAVTLIDTPGHVDFTWEVSRCLRVLDGGVVVISGPDGVQAQTRSVWHQAVDHALPVIGWVNKLDRPGMVHEALLDEISETLGIEPLPMQIPLEYGSGVVTVLDLITGEKRTWRDATKQLGTRPPELSEPTADELLLREVALERLGDALASHDDALAERLIDGEPVPRELWLRALVAAVRDRACLPLYYGCARAGIGIQALMEAIVDVLPSPQAAASPLLFPTGEEGPGEAVNPDAPLIAYVFKTETRPGGRRVAWVRVFAGALMAGASCTRLPRGETFTPTQVLELEGGLETKVPRLGAGEVGAILVSDARSLPRTGETLTSGSVDRCFEPFGAPSPVVALTLEAQRPEDLGSLRDAATALVQDDDSLALAVDRDTGHLVLSGMGELHLEVICERLRLEQKLDFRTGAMAPRRQRSLVGPVAGKGSFHLGEIPDGEAEVTLRIEPSSDETSSVLLEIEVTDPLQRNALVDGVKQILFDRADLHGVTALVTSVSSRGGGLSPRCFWEAGSEAATHCLSRAELVELTPWVRLTLAIPDDRMGGVLGDLARRGVRIRATVTRGTMQVLTGDAPLGAMIHYATDLRSLTGGRGSVTIEAAGFRPDEAAR